MQRHSSVRPHICGICGKGFVHKSYLMEHMSYHTGERQFQCYHCGNRFQAQSALVKHMKRHTSTKDFACNNCPKAFAVKTDLKSHIRLVHEKPQVPCAIKPSPTENHEENSTLNESGDDTDENIAVDKTATQQEDSRVNDKPEDYEQSLVHSSKETTEMNCEGVQDLIKSIGPDNIIKALPDLPSDETKSSNIVNITSVVSDESKPRTIEDKTVPILKAAVNDQIPAVSISESPPDKTKEIIPYIPNVPKV